MAMTKEELEKRIYGCSIEDLRRSLADSIAVKLNAGGYPMVAMSILSDAQEMLAAGQAERARQEINRAKWVITEYLMKPPSENAALLLKHYVVTGRIPGADEDDSIYVGQHADQASAVRAFQEAITQDLSDQEKADIVRLHTGRSGVYVYPTSVIASDAPMQVSSAPEPDQPSPIERPRG